MQEKGTVRRALAAGLRNHSPLIVAVAALLAVATLAGLQWFVASGTFTVLPERLMLRIPNDDYVHVSYRIAELKAKPPAGPVVYLFGGSGTMEMMRSEAVLARDIAAAGGPPVTVISLAAHQQTIGQTLALIDNLPRGHGLLAIGLSPNRLLATPAADARQVAGSPMALTSPHLAVALAGRASLKERLPGLLSGICDYAVSYANQRILTRAPDLSLITYAHHYHSTNDVANGAARLSGSLVELNRERPRFAANVAYNLAMLGAAVRLGREKGYDVTFFQQPLAPEASGPAWQAYLAGYRRDLAGVMRAAAVPDIDVQPKAALQADDFYDLFHLVNSGRDKWSPPFAAGLARELRQA
jgi:hypothetical protein